MVGIKVDAKVRHSFGAKVKQGAKLHTNYDFSQIFFRNNVFPYNLPNVLDLRLTFDVIVAIFIGDIVKWNDPRIAAHNPALSTCDKKIRVLARIDRSKNTEILTTALSNFSSKWRTSRGIFDSPDLTQNLTWSNAWQRLYFDDIFFVNKTVGMISVVDSMPYSFGYAYQAAVVNQKLNATLIMYKPDIAQDTFNHSRSITFEDAILSQYANVLLKDPTVNDTLSSTINFMLSWTQITFSTAKLDCEQLFELILFTYWLTYHPSAHDLLRSMDLDNVDDILSKYVDELTIKKIQCKGENIYDKILANSRLVRNNRPSGSIFIDHETIIVYLVVATVLLTIISLAGYFGYSKFRKSRRTIFSWLLQQSQVAMAGVKMTSIASLNTLHNENADSELKKWSFYTHTVGHHDKKPILMFKSGCYRDPESFKGTTTKKLCDMTCLAKCPNVVALMGEHCTLVLNIRIGQ
uniref:Uncharacterized protein n=1 Tax=Romanomermis culicivorax TaxID=13658 RepID=A0A915K7C2_ROMCU